MDKDGEKKRPIMIHRVVMGSIERFIGILTEHFAGAFPLWLAPVQVQVMTITQRADEWAQELSDKLRAAGIRVETDLRNEKIGFKIREAQVQKVPYMIVLGDREVEERCTSVRHRSEGDLGSMSVDELVERLKREIAEKKI